MEQDIRSVTDPIPRSEPTDVTVAAPDTTVAPPLSAPKKASYFLPIAYVIFESLSGPLIFLLLSNFIVNWVHVPDDASWYHYLVMGIIIFLFLLSGALVIGNIVHSFRVYRNGDSDHCLTAMLIIRYGMIPFFFFNAVFSYIMVAFIGFGLRSTALYLSTLAFAFIHAFLLMLPGAFFGIQVIRFSLREKKINRFTAVLHGIAQFIAIVGVMDTAYLSAVKWQKAQKMTLAVFIIVVVYLGLNALSRLF